MANTGNVNENNRLVELRGSGYEMVKGEPDIRGWDVKDNQGRTFGKVDEVLFDKESEKVRYIVLNLKGNVLNLKSRKVLIPVGLAQLDEHNDDVIFSEITAVHLTELPEYKRTPITFDEEGSIRDIFAGLGNYGTVETKSSSATSSGSLSDDRSNFYQHAHFDDKHLFEKRQPSSSQQPGSATDLKSFEEGTIEFTEKKEVPIITKEAKVVEEISLNKEIEEHDATVRDTVRKTDVEIEHDRKDDERDKRVRS